eukprot:8930063-Pyramimonas_sp.AAC.1
MAYSNCLESYIRDRRTAFCRTRCARRGRLATGAQAQQRPLGRRIKRDRRYDVTPARPEQNIMEHGRTE